MTDLLNKVNHADICVRASAAVHGSQLSVQILAINRVMTNPWTLACRALNAVFRSFKIFITVIRYTILSSRI
jgi:hypothetical protein